MADTVTRKEIRSLSATELERYISAMAFMQQGGVTSPYFRVAGLHGWPSHLCAHGKQTFPTWHRPYLLEFEKELRAADRALGRDGLIGIPYWDWLSYGGQMPRVFREDPRLNQLPPNFFVGRSDLPEGLWGRLAREDDMNFSSFQARTREVANSMNMPWNLFAFQPERPQPRGASIETPHNNIHGGIGHQMGNPDTAAFDPIFWLHHANVDRLIEQYMMNRTYDVCRRESQALAATANEMMRWGVNLYNTTFPEFQNWAPAQSFAATSTLGYTYATIPPIPRPSRELRAAPAAVFSQIKVQDMGNLGYQLHVFLVNSEHQRPLLGLNRRDFDLLPNYAGMTAIFSGRTDCENCKQRAPFSVSVDISETLERMQTTRHDVEMFVIAIDTIGVPHELKDTNISKPSLEGPQFSNMDDTLTHTGHKEEIKNLQRLLASRGCYSGPIDGVFSKTLPNAVKKFQKIAGIGPTGDVCAETKKKLVAPSFDTKKPTSGENTFERGQTVKYYLGPSPSVERAVVETEVQEACDKWGEVTGLSWVLTNDWDNADVEIIWHDQDFHHMLKKNGKEWVDVEDADIEQVSNFDGPGGQLAHSGDNFIHLDITERWISRDKPKAKAGEFRIFNVVLHELGHVLGLNHSANPEAVMSQFYGDSVTELTDDDIKAVQELYGEGGGTEEKKVQPKEAAATTPAKQGKRKEAAAKTPPKPAATSGRKRKEAQPAARGKGKRRIGS